MVGGGWGPVPDASPPRGQARPWRASRIIAGNSAEETSGRIRSFVVFLFLLDRALDAIAFLVGDISGRGSGGEWEAGRKDRGRNHGGEGEEEVFAHGRNVNAKIASPAETSSPELGARSCEHGRLRSRARGSVASQARPCRYFHRQDAKVAKKIEDGGWWIVDERDPVPRSVQIPRHDKSEHRSPDPPRVLADMSTTTSTHSQSCARSGVL